MSLEINEKRFRFGANWRNFLGILNDRRVLEAQRSLQMMFGVERMDGKRFLDIGCGSGVFSLAARRLGACVHSFDYDTDSVECTKELRARYESDYTAWCIEKGSVLDTAYLSKLGFFDYVYCWGVLHHTGSMWRALEYVVPLVDRGGRLYIALYNDQGWVSRYWREIKKAYNKGFVSQALVILIHAPYLFVGRFLARAMSGRLEVGRGMSLWYDMLDWLGGWPFEVARPDVVLDFVQKRGLSLVTLKTCGKRHGCNEFVFAKA